MNGRRQLPSKAKVDRAGDLLRTWTRARSGSPGLKPVPLWTRPDPQDADFDSDPGLAGALEVVVEWREAHVWPLLQVQSSVAELAWTLGHKVVPTGRPKTVPAIVGKLGRFPTMRLSQMEDIAGCRVTLGTQEQVDGVLARALQRWPDATLIDHVATPRSTGYRAKHVIVVEDSLSVEVQLRSARQNRWADEVERWADSLGYPLKDGEGPDDLVRYFEVAAAAEAAKDEGREPDVALESSLGDLRAKVRPYFERGRPHE